MRYPLNGKGGRLPRQLVGGFRRREGKRCEQGGSGDDAAGNVGRAEMVKWSRRSTMVFVGVCLVGGLGLGAVISLTLRPHVAPSVATSSPGPIVSAPLSRQAAAPFTLTDQEGNSVSLAAQKGQVVLLTFLDPQCVQLCPVIGRDIAAVEQKLPKGLSPELLIVSVASGRTKADVDHFISTNVSTQWLPGWHWLLGPNDAALKLVWLHWHISVIPTAADIEHDALLNVIDREGFLRVTYPAPLYVGDVVSDIIKISHT